MQTACSVALTQPSCGMQAGHVPGLGVRKATAKGGLGERLLKSMGWSEGKGLGRQEDGIASAIEVKKKDDAAGV